MNGITVFENGKLSFYKNGREFITPSPVGILVIGGCAYAPISAKQSGADLTLCYEVGDVQLRVCDCNCGRYFKIIVTSVPEGTQNFVFGPYETKGSEYGEILGASWNADGSVVCIQSLMPKVEGGIALDTNKESKISLHRSNTACLNDDRITLQCSARNHSKETTMEYYRNVAGYFGNAVGTVNPLISLDPHIAGASVALIAAESRDELLDVISDMELREGLPHPMFEGKYAKKNKRVSSIYMIFSGTGINATERIDIAKRAGLRCIYFVDLLDKWGHFTINEEFYPGGKAEIKALSELAAKSGLNIGTHNLSNFVTTHDAYVTPVPHHNLLVMDTTELARDVNETDTVLYIKDENNYKENSVLNSLRIDDELITFESYDSTQKKLLNCKRGAFGTCASAHREGDSVKRLWDHPYKTLFPDAELQGEMADNLANTLRECGIKRTSFDGLEGCQYTGHGEYGVSEFVRRVYEQLGNELICDASITGNYIWHALSYANWGEPWYDSERRGGQHSLRINNQTYFKNNLMPAMMGWYRIFDAKGKFEATTPENMEFMLSRSAAFDAGLALAVNARVAKAHGLFYKYLDLVRLWEDFRFNAHIPDDVREKMQDEDSNWHLEKYNDGWKLTALNIRRQDLDYGDRDVETEAGKIYRSGKTDTESELKYHSSIVCMSNSLASFDDVFTFRLRVGSAGHGMMKNLSFGLFKFEFTAEGGDYLVYLGGKELYHYDLNFNLKKVIDGGAEGLAEHERHPDTHSFVLFDFQYATDRDEAASYILTTFNRKAEYIIKRKNDGENQ